uniref:Uncharacterized protein LOC104230999 n=1 Tax=Nicotiana sylvestris TaxID=4096 RepID=A0A1U7WY35_NICSY
MHSGICYLELPICYGCGMRDHIQRHYRVSRQGADRGAAQSSNPVASTSSAPFLARGTPAPAGHGAVRGGAQSSGRPSRFYAMSGRQTVEASLDVVTKPDQLHKLFSVSTPVGEPVTVARVYRGCVVTVHGRDNMADLVELGMVDFHALEKVKIIKERLKTAQNRQSSYSDVRHRDLEFKEDDWVVGDPTTIVSVETTEVNEELSSEEVPVTILDRKVRKLRNKEITSVKALWRNQQ